MLTDWTGVVKLASRLAVSSRLTALAWLQDPREAVLPLIELVY